jgi:hypothetical protein
MAVSATVVAYTFLAAGIAAVNMTTQRCSTATSYGIENTQVVSIRPPFANELPAKTLQHPSQLKSRASHSV